MSLRHTPVHARHRAAGAKMVAFAGYDMPVVYSGIVDEHHAVRRSAGLFDVSHMGEIRLRGPDAEGLAQRVFSNDALGLRAGRVRYGLVCAPDGGVIDDVTLYRVADDELLFCVNASNVEEDLAWIQGVQARENFKCDVIDETETTGLLAIQGPNAIEITMGLVADAEPPPRRWRFRRAVLAGVPVWLSGTGYTGEAGFEIYAPAEATASLWDALLEAGGDRIQPAGLGARDTLRTEMGYSLYGHELDRDHNGLEAGLERFIAGREFIGADALAKAGTPTRRLVGLWVEGRAVPRTGYPLHGDDAPTGSVTSGTFGASVERSIAIGYVRARDAAPGTRLSVEIRTRRVPCVVTPFPFYSRT